MVSSTGASKFKSVEAEIKDLGESLVIPLAFSFHCGTVKNTIVSLPELAKGAGSFSAQNKVTKGPTQSSQKKQPLTN